MCMLNTPRTVGLFLCPWGLLEGRGGAGAARGAGGGVCVCPWLNPLPTPEKYRTLCPHQITVPWLEGAGGLDFVPNQLCYLSEPRVSSSTQLGVQAPVVHTGLILRGFYGLSTAERGEPRYWGTWSNRRWVQRPR